MASVKPDTTIKEYQNFVKEVYGLSNNRYFDLQGLLNNVERFAMRGLKGIRKEDNEKTRINLLIALSWFMSIMNQLHIDIEDKIWKRFPYLCSYCASCPCICKKEKLEERRDIYIDEAKRPKTLKDFQRMFDEIYPARKRTIEHAGIHLAEEIGEFAETLLIYHSLHKEDYFKKIEVEAADLFSCILAVFSSLNIDVATELSSEFSNNCHVCKNKPCTCTFMETVNFKS
jgi:NTP pyrophosphatase (non-canonical NTP hydrolase)